ncbi:MAG: Asp23/Gls24 family envelope stress response protein [Verrucomicrobia bacterium]|nr:MAG: Asp23/Gls24 family envelope stress response protein [Verrucomicrobiota bacterium]
MNKIDFEEGIPMINENPGSLGDIKINHSVVANIARIAATEIDGVYPIDSSIVDGITEIFSKKESDRGVRVSEDPAGDYIIEIRVILRFGVALAKVAIQVQENVKDKISKMTMKNVSRVDVIIDGVRNEAKPKSTPEINPEEALE